MILNDCRSLKSLCSIDQCAAVELIEMDVADLLFSQPIRSKVKTSADQITCTTLATSCMFLLHTLMIYLNTTFGCTVSPPGVLSDLI